MRSTNAPVRAFTERPLDRCVRPQLRQNSRTGTPAAYAALGPGMVHGLHPRSSTPYQALASARPSRVALGDLDKAPLARSLHCMNVRIDYCTV